MVGKLKIDTEADHSKICDLALCLRRFEFVYSEKIRIGGTLNTKSLAGYAISTYLPHLDTVDDSVGLYYSGLMCAPGSDSSITTALQDFSVAQVGSKRVVDGKKFVKRLRKRVIRELIPALLREIADGNERILAAADRCELEGTSRAAQEAAGVAAMERMTGQKDSALAMLPHLRVVLLAILWAAAGGGYWKVQRAWMGAFSGVVPQAMLVPIDSYKYLRMAAQFAVDELRRQNSPGCLRLPA